MRGRLQWALTVAAFVDSNFDLARLMEERVLDDFWFVLFRKIIEDAARRLLIS